MNFKKLISATLVASMITGLSAIGMQAKAPLPFDDVADTWYKPAVETVYSEGVMTGKSDTKFDPTANITRAEVVTAFSRIACVNITGYEDSLDFKDTVAGQWYSDPVGWAAENGIVKGRGDNSFSPADKITRAELASILVNFINYMGLELESNAKLDRFTDEGTFADWMKPAIDEVRRTGLMQGVDGKFNPLGNATRAEIAQVVKNILPLTGRVTVVEDGISDYVIVASENGSDAAERLQYQIEYTTGAKLVITDKSSSDKAIVLGGTSINTEGFGADGFEIKFDGNRVLIDGETSDGIYKGAVRFALAAVSGNDARFTAKSIESYRTTYPVNGLKINGNDISKYTVFYPADASKETVTGAEDIVKYIELACGVKIGTSTGKPSGKAIIIEEKRVDVSGQFDNVDNFSIKSEGDNIRITGSAERGAMFGCYDFLEEYVGCRFLTDKVDYIIPADQINISNVDHSETPGFIYRKQYTPAILKSQDWMNKLRNASAQFTGGSSHTFDSLDEGFSTQYESQPCLTSEEVYETILKNVMALLAKNPDAKLISVSQNDNENYCKCDNCMEAYKKYTNGTGIVTNGGVAGVTIEFVNRIAAEVEKIYPDVTVHTFAYLFTKVPPVGIKARKNVMVQLCTDYCCRKHNYLDGCDGNNLISNAIKGWSEVTDTLYYWDYRTGSDTPCPEIMNTKILDDARAFADHGSLGVFTQGGTRSANDAGFFELRTYLEGKVYWNPFMTEDEYFTHINDFVTGFYGKEAGKLILKAQTLYESSNKFCNSGYGDSTGFIIMELRDIISDVVDIMYEASLKTESKQSFIYTDRANIQFECWKLECEWKDGHGTSAETDDYLNRQSHALRNKYLKYNILPQNFEEFPYMEVFTAPPSKWGKMIEEFKGED